MSAYQVSKRLINYIGKQARQEEAGIFFENSDDWLNFLKYQFLSYLNLLYL